MKKIIIPMIVVVIILVYFSYMRFVPHGNIDVDGYLFTSNKIVENLVNQSEDTKNIDYQKVDINDTIYQRGEELFIGTEKKYQINKDLNIYGKVEKGSDCFVTKTNQKGINHRFVENTASLTKKTKNEIVDNFLNKKKRVVYLVETKKQP